MSLRQKMSLQITAMLLGALLLSASALWGINALHQEYDLALAGFRELGEVYGKVGPHVAIAQELLRASPVERERAAEQLEQAAERFEVYLSSLRGGPTESPRDPAAERTVRDALAAAVAQLQVPRPPDPAKEHDLEVADMTAIQNVMLQIQSYAMSINHVVYERQQAAGKRRRDTIVAVAGICSVIFAGAVVLGVVQYRNVMSPLNRLRAGVRKIAGAEFKQRLNERGTAEFAELADEFNKMAAELDEFYHRLEEKVNQKSRELIRSERLASVGYLAAGVAHEINNPIGIIAGYAEYTLSQLKQAPNASNQEETAKSLQIIADEAFRCKDIIGKLLSLARGGEARRSDVDLGRVAQDVASAVTGLRDFRDRKLAVQVRGEGGLQVSASEAEMKQVVLNLTINALEAVQPGGEVRIDCGRNDGLVELRVRDDGRGMTPEVLDRVFEPFFTDKRGTRQPGTGLGLSISHAIVESHGGRIRAASAGPGKGSEFVVQLPASQGIE
jgi:signal transduction histidine kinase